MFDDFKKQADRVDEIDRLLSDPSVSADPAKCSVLLKERSRLVKWATKYREFEKTLKHLEEAQAMAAGEKDPEVRELAQAEVRELKEAEAKMRLEMEEQLLSADADTSRSVIVELRPGVGGDEAALFAQELLQMYMKFAKRRGWATDLIEVVTTELGGLNYATFSIEGEDVYKHLRFESGTHRVQRVPATEASGRVHTSTATVAVLPQAEDVDVTINDKDLRIDTYSAGGPGGQHVNKTQSAVRITHLPTNIVVQCQDQRSQIRNRELAMRWLRAKLYEHEQTKQKKAMSDLRRSQIGSGDRSEKIRTYNFHDNRITDHRIGFSLHDLAGFMEGGLDPMVAKLLEADRAEKLKGLGGGKKP
ncbi:MAG TPA: peptide chain release factor 1 [Planctomycetota bacterium]|nr:peptide chain release factor 1 [Planctomycetota bacterium]